jgi:hypothetical protein
MPETVPGIVYDKEGVCNLCRAYVPHQCRDEAELKQLLGENRRPGSPYDCIVPVSGGRDSTFVLYTAVKTYGLRALAVNYDNEFRIDQALTNMQNACRRLGVELVRVRSGRNIARKMVRASVLAALPYGLGPMATTMCDACVYGYKSAAYRVAEQHQVSLILWGHSSIEETGQMLRAVGITFAGLTRRKKLLNLQFYKAQVYGLLQRREFPVSGNRVLSREPVRLRNRTIREVRLFDYLSWNRNEIKQTITNELGWQKPAGHVSTWRTDCKLHVLMNYCWLSQLGCTKDCFGYCSMINGGQLSRAEALEQEKQAVAAAERDALEVLRSELALSEAELATIASDAARALH